MLLVILVAALITFMVLSGVFSTREGSSSYECGFDGKDKSRTPTPMVTFLFAILFILFDVEFMLLLNVMWENEGGLWSSWFSLVIFVTVLVGTALLEWRNNSIQEFVGW